MKIHYVRLLLITLASFLSHESYAVWGKTGHRTIGEVAQQNLTPKTTEIVNTLLEGMSLAFVSTYADEIRSDNRFGYLAPWHYVNIDENIRYSEAPKNPNGDIVSAITYCIEMLKNSESSADDKAFHLKLLVHFIGDIHQPMHAGRKTDKGGNDISLKWFGTSTNLHRLWDSNLIDFYKMSYTELAASLPNKTPKEKARLMATPLLDWVNESQDLAQDIYANTPADSSLGYTYHYANFDTVRRRLLEAGLRLAATLNAIFDPTYRQ